MADSGSLACFALRTPAQPCFLLDFRYKVPRATVGEIKLGKGSEGIPTGQTVHVGGLEEGELTRGRGGRVRGRRQRGEWPVLSAPDKGQSKDRRKHDQRRVR